MSIRELKGRRGTRRLHEIDELRAVKRDLVPEGMRDTPPADRAQVAPFEKAGWKFMQEADVPGDVPAARVLLEESNGERRLVLSPSQMTVRFQPDVSRNEIEELLRTVGAAIVGELPVAPNTFIVELGPNGDVFEVSAALGEEAAVKYAEPELVELMSSRQS